MDCPKCCYTLKHFETNESVTLDLCTGCKGIWYDKGELGFMQELERDIPELEHSNKTKKETAYACPHCADDTLLEELKYSAGEKLLIDRCPQCEGIWLDSGELRKVEHIAAQSTDFAARFARALKDLDDRGYQILGQKKTG